MFAISPFRPSKLTDGALDLKLSHISSSPRQSPHQLYFAHYWLKLSLEPRVSLLETLLYPSELILINPYMQRTSGNLHCLTLEILLIGVHLVARCFAFEVIGC